MPMYQFRCNACNATLDKHFGFTDKQEVTCKCGEQMQKVISAVGVIFTGNGWGGQK